MVAQVKGKRCNLSEALGSDGLGFGFGFLVLGLGLRLWHVPSCLTGKAATPGVRA